MPAVPSEATRPPVTVVVPFAGGDAAAAAALDAVATLELAPTDALIVVDNGGDGEIAALGRARGVEMLVARERSSSYHARNAGARAATSEWILFMDADCRPDPLLIDRYFDEQPGKRTGALAGTVRPGGEPETRLERHAASRGLLDQSAFLDRGEPFAATANLMVRRSAWEQVEGFAEVRSGGDVDFSWRILDAGWLIDARPGASVRHLHRKRLWPFLRQRVRYGAGAAWLDRRHPGRRPRARPLRGAARSVVAAGGRAMRGRGDDAGMHLVDAAAYVAHAIGRRLSNEPS